MEIPLEIITSILVNNRLIFQMAVYQIGLEYAMVFPRAILLLVYIYISIK